MCLWCLTWKYFVYPLPMGAVLILSNYRIEHTNISYYTLLSNNWYHTVPHTSICNQNYAIMRGISFDASWSAKLAIIWETTLHKERFPRVLCVDEKTTTGGNMLLTNWCFQNQWFVEYNKCQLFVYHNIIIMQNICSSYASEIVQYLNCNSLTTLRSDYNKMAAILQTKIRNAYI